MIDSLGDVGAVLSDARPERLSRLYQDLCLELQPRPDVGVKCSVIRGFRASHAVTAQL